MLNRLADSTNSQTSVYTAAAMSDTASSSNRSSNGQVALLEKKLPYQVNHQVELLHLQAETEALLRQLQSLKQQRTESAEAVADMSMLPQPATADC